MRIRWNETNIEEVALVDFCECSKANEHPKIYLGGRDLLTDEWQCWGEVLVSEFPNDEEARAWVKATVKSMMVNGYIDMVDCPYIDLY